VKKMSVDDLDVGKCPICGEEMIEKTDDLGQYIECEFCGYRE
jgi:predicted RNA-binding Zn-ribbon protein involved in translation (DUF1610 family)